MKRLIGAIFATIAIFNCGLAHADSITGNVTGDNNISYWNGSSWTALGTNWQQSETINLNVTAPNDTVYFAVSNDLTSPGNPADGGNPSVFAGSFTDNTGTFGQTGTNTLLSNTTNFEILAVSPFNTTPEYPALPDISTINPPNSLNPTALTGFITPTSYGTNTSGGSLWANANGGPVGSIDPNAQFIWTDSNGGTYESEDNYAIIGVNLGVNAAVTPEPPTLLLFAFAGALVLLFKRKKILSVA